MGILRPPQLKRLETAPEYFIDGVSNIQFMGVNTRCVVFRNAMDDGGLPYRRAVVTLIGPTGALPGVIRTLFGFAIEHRLPVPEHYDATR